MRPSCTIWGKVIVNDLFKVMEGTICPEIEQKSADFQFSLASIDHILFPLHILPSVVCHWHGY